MAISYENKQFLRFLQTMCYMTQILEEKNDENIGREKKVDEFVSFRRSNGTLWRYEGLSVFVLASDQMFRSLVEDQ